MWVVYLREGVVFKVYRLEIRGLSMIVESLRSLVARGLFLELESFVILWFCEFFKLFFEFFFLNFKME